MDLSSDRYIFNFKEKSRFFSVIFMFSLRSAGDMHHRENFKFFLRTIKPQPKKIISSQQVHGAKVGLVKDNSPSLFLGCDALITREKRSALAVFTADCLSIFLYDFKNKTIGLIHAGWRSTKKDIVFKTLKLMKESFNTDPKNLYIAFGPAIRDCCYEVGEEFRDFFSKKYIIKRKNRLYFDLVAINRDALINFGVNKKHILDSFLCTSCYNDILFSYRKEGVGCGRIVSLAMLV